MTETPVISGTVILTPVRCCGMFRCAISTAHPDCLGCFDKLGRVKIIKSEACYQKMNQMIESYPVLNMSKGMTWWVSKGGEGNRCLKNLVNTRDNTN